MKRAGFTLIEVVLAAALFVMGMSMIMGVYSFGSALSRSAELRSLSSDAAEALFADLSESLFPLRDDGLAGPPRVIEDREVPGMPGLRYSVEAVPNLETLEILPDVEEPVAREYTVTVEARWQAAGVKRAATWTTIMLRELPFGARMRQRFLPKAATGTGG